VTALKLAVKKDKKKSERLEKCNSGKQRAKELIRRFSLDSSSDEKTLLKGEFNFKLNSNEKRLLLFEAMYRDLLSDDFCYHIGALGPDMDLFFLNILLNRRDMAQIFWVRSAQVILS
jgi:hypothetical protein